MRAVRLGKTGLQVSKVGLGGIPITRPSEDVAVRVIQRALDLGINLIDTSIAYGVSEERIGKAIADRRDQVIISTKGGWRERNHVPYSIEASLKRLKTDYIDIWQFHGVNNFKAYEVVFRPDGAFEAAQEALKAGRIRHIGMSSHSLDVALKVVSSGLIETIMFPLNFVSSEAEDKLLSAAKEHDVGFMAMKPFAGGRIKAAHLAIKYLMQFDNVVPVAGVEAIEQVEEIVNIANSPRKLTEREKQKIKGIRARVGKRFCHQCEYCMPCPQGVLISGIMYLNVLWELWPPEWFLSWDYIKGSVESFNKCAQCGECEKKCPYQLPIREMMADNIKFYERVAKKKPDTK